MGQAESFDNELCDFDFEGSVEEKRNFWVFMEGLNLCFDSFYGTFYSIKYSQTENLFHLLDEHIDALRLDCHLWKPDLLSVRHLHEDSLQLKRNDNLLLIDLRCRPMLDGAQSFFAVHLLVDEKSQQDEEDGIGEEGRGGVFLLNNAIL